NRPNFNVGTSLSYLSRKIRAGVTLDYASAIKWMTLSDTLSEDGIKQFTYTRTNGTLTLGVEVEWRINDRWAVYAEGRNLTGSKLYEWLNYYRSTPEGMLGVKFSL
ncbi:MAG: TonB-dependent receptor, partial [Alistipes sp.]|nr:TonB-dependent receptor [Alistipes sp.]